MSPLRSALSAVALCAALAAPLAAEAGRVRDGDGPVQIRFARGAVCWRYTGRAWQFTGRFARGQTVTVRATGLATLGDGRRTWTESHPRDPLMTYHRGEAIEGEDGVYEIPETAAYDISLWPHYMQGGLGTTTICAR